MKNLYTYMGVALMSVFAFASCDKNEPAKFNDKDAFVAFDKVTVNVSEDYSKDGAVLQIPVTLASVKGLESTFRFEVNEPESKAAKAGVNYELVTSSGVLSFDSENRTRYIEIKTIADGEYTGDLSFSITLFGNDEVQVGSENTCTVTINDVDHPLGFMLGAYTASGVNYWDGPSEWTMTFYKDAKDDHKVWIDNLFDVAGWANEKTRYYGIVNDELDTINIPFGQETEYKYSNGNPVLLLGFDGSRGYESGSMDVKIIRNGDSVTLDFGTEWGIWVYIEDAGNLNITNPGITAVKN